MDIKPCPFCGEKFGHVANLLDKEHGGKYRDGWGVECGTCTASVSAYKTKDEAITAWNTRQQLAEQPQEVVEYIERLEEDVEGWRYFIETASGEAAFELTGVTDASNQQINEAIDQAIASKPKDKL